MRCALSGFLLPLWGTNKDVDPPTHPAAHELTKPRCRETEELSQQGTKLRPKAMSFLKPPLKYKARLRSSPSAQAFWDATYLLYSGANEKQVYVFL